MLFKDIVDIHQIYGWTDGQMHDRRMLSTITIALSYKNITFKKDPHKTGLGVAFTKYPLIAS